ncbi:MAG: hypothetical protein DHS20C18_26350 [Saprospiraceae bacterium]|nr:MAG: hypothetical protein DHS20C18_26350 [Saprospiraceae bacterium]
MKLIIGNTNFQGVHPPNICPHCHVANNPKYKFAEQTKDTDGEDSNISVWQCASQKCLRLFVAIYKRVEDKPKLIRFLNGYPKGPDFPKPIKELKHGELDENGDAIQSKFIKTYLQSLEA